MPRNRDNRNPHEYPQTVAQVLNPAKKYKRGVLSAVRALKRTRPYRLDSQARARAVRRLYAKLAAIYGIRVPRLTARWSIGTSGRSCYMPNQHRIELSGRFSAVTTLHEFAHALGKDEFGACRWSINLFARVWPRLFARCQQIGHTLQLPDRD